MNLTPSPGPPALWVTGVPDVHAGEKLRSVCAERKTEHMAGVAFPTVWGIP